ncbi:hypothetical protein MCL36_17215 [Acinetobacter pittii]|uniref:hypothetical protein n=1 Tax=Acinetobacter pittii TaxID=48296 RepID=UPI001EFC56CE|nr:hypothetical protein [Acinetobacter pittii]MCG9494266.1 hypothetical protein [Acinetobacter pittii]
MYELHVLIGIIIALLIEIMILKMLIKKLSAGYLITFITIILLLLLCWISVYFTKISPPDGTILNQNGSIFTIIGAVFTAVNTVVVIYLMIWLHHKESQANLFPRFQELQDKLTKISSIFDQEVDSFLDKQSAAATELEMIHFEAPNSSPQYERAYSSEITNIDEIIVKIHELKSKLRLFRDKFYSISLDIDNLKVTAIKIHKVDELSTLHRPINTYMKAFHSNYYADDRDPDDMILEAKNNALTSIQQIIDILEEKAP